MVNSKLTLLFVIFLFLFVIDIVSAIEMVRPISKNIEDGDIVFVGVIGPGQTFEVLIKREVTTGGIYNTGGSYDRAIVTGLPEGWKVQDSELYANPLQVKITAAKNASEGEYFANITVIDEQGSEKLDNITFKVKIKIIWDVIGVDVTPEKTTVGPLQPARVYITVTNKGTASDTFEITCTGQKRWEFAKNLYVASGSSKTVTLEIIEKEQENYIGEIEVKSVSSPDIIKYEKNISISVVNQNVFDDYKATNNGILIFPMLESLIYSLAGLLSNLF